MKIIYNDEIKEIKVKKNETVLDVIRRADIPFSAPCNGNGTCNKCQVELNGKKVKSCKTLADNKDTIIIKAQKFSILSNDNIDSKNESSNKIGLALDLGTTTIVYSFVDLEKKDIIKTLSFVNPTDKYGRDIISKIKYSIDNKNTSDLFNEINKKTNEVINNFLEEVNAKKIDKMVVSGNTVMLHIFLNKNIDSFGSAPFTPSFLDCIRINGSKLKLKVNEIILMPSFSSFVGGDISSGYISTNLEKGNNILIDIGTNGEILANISNKTYACSVAAGPAFEGGNIECGTGSISGAIAHFDYVNNHLKIETIDSKKPLGICGSGLIDIVDYLLKNNIIDKKGQIQKENKKYFVTDKIYISQKDMRNFQLAKSAIRSGIETIIKYTKINIDNIDNVYISGGFGFYINVDKAINVGLLSPLLKDKYKAKGNTSLEGSIKVLFNESLLDKVIDCCKKTEIIDLSTNKTFNKLFINNMSF